MAREAQQRERGREGLLPRNPIGPSGAPPGRPPISPDSAPPPTPEDPPDKWRRPKALNYAIIRLGVPFAIAALGIGLMMADRFSYGVALLYLGLGLFALDIAYEDFFRNRSLPLKIVAGLISAALITTISVTLIFRAAPFEVFTSSSVPRYGPGSKLHGIEWLPRYSELNVDLGNPSSTDYDDFDAEVTTDLVINHLVQTGGLGNCKLDSIHGANEPPHWQHMQGDQPVGPIDNPNWEYQVIPYDKNHKLLAPFSGADWTYRIRCDKIPANSHLTLLGALVLVNPKAYDCNAPCPYPFFDPPKPAKWVTILARFQTSGRGRVKNILRCQIGSICKTE